MKNIQVYSLLILSFALTGCSYFYTSHTEDGVMQLSSKDLKLKEKGSWYSSPYGSKTNVERLIYQGTQGGVELYGFDDDGMPASEQEKIGVVEGHGVYARDSVEIFPLDPAMEKTLNPLK